jgi:hypothetical protein
MDTHVTLTIQISHLNDTTVHEVRKYRADYNMNPPNTVSFIFLQLQEFCPRNQIVDSSTTVTWLSLPSSKTKLV